MQTRSRLSATPRENVRKKSALRSLRRSGNVPGSIFGHGDPRPIQVPLRMVDDFLRHHAVAALLDLDVDGQVTPAMIREIDRDPISGEVIHLGFQRIDLGETIRATLSIVFSGEETLIRNGLVLQRQMDALDVHGRADALPEALMVDVSEAHAGTTIRISDLKLPQGIEASKDPSQAVVSITAPTVPADVEAALEAEEQAHKELVASHGTADAEEEEEAAAAV